MKETYGRSSISSYNKRDLISSLGSKLQQRLDTVGLTGSPLTSKVMVTSCSLPYYQLTCLGLRMRDAGYSGEPSIWRTPRWCPLGDPSWCSGYLQEHSEERLSSSKSFWENGEWLEGTEGKSFLVEPRTFPLCNGVPYRLELLRGYGNAIVPQLGALFITSFLDTILAKL